jgi:hypothetical protein
MDKPTVLISAHGHNKDGNLLSWQQVITVDPDIYPMLRQEAADPDDDGPADIDKSPLTQIIAATVLLAKLNGIVDPGEDNIDVRFRKSDNKYLSNNRTN